MTTTSGTQKRTSALIILGTTIGTTVSRSFLKSGQWLEFMEYYGGKGPIKASEDVMQAYEELVEAADLYEPTE